MRGAPFLQAISMVALFLLAGWPVYRLTRPAAPPPAESARATPGNTDSPTPKAAPLEVEAQCASAPTELLIKCLDQTVLAGRAPQAHFSTRWAAAVPPEGADLIILARWPAPGAGDSAAPGAGSGANPAVVRVTVRAGDGQQVEKSCWADASGTVNDVFTIPGAPAKPAP